MTNREMKKTTRGFIKKGLVFCVVGVMAFSMVACSGHKKKAAGSESKTKTEATQNKTGNQSGSSKVTPKSGTKIGRAHV